MVSCGTPGCSCTPIPYPVNYCPGCGSEDIFENEKYDDEWNCEKCGWIGEILPCDQPTD